MKFIYFDVGNVFHTFEHIYESAAREFNLSPDDIGNMFDKYNQEITLGNIDAKKLWQLCCRELNIVGGENYDFAHSWASDYVVIPSMHEYATELSKKYKIGILSNHYIGTFAESFSQHKIPNLKYSSVIMSSEVHLQKPQPEIYILAEEKCGFKGSDIFFIDDKQKNLDEAANHGWQTFLFDYKHPEKSVSELKIILL